MNQGGWGIGKSEAARRDTEELGKLRVESIAGPDVVAEETTRNMRTFELGSFSIISEIG